MLVGIGRFVPRHAGAIGERQHHEAERTVGPFGEAERHLVPNLPELGGRHHIDLGVDAAFLPLLGHRLDRRLFPGRIGLAHDLDIETVRKPASARSFFASSGLKPSRSIFL